MLKATLNDVEQRICKYVAKKRFEHCRKIKSEATVYGSETAKFREFNSYGAELAFCRLWNIYPDTEYEKFGIEDCELPSGKLVDIKCTTLENGRLMVKKIKRKGETDYFVLMIGRFPTYRFAGAIKREDIITEDRLDSTLHHPAYCADQSYLLEEIC